MINRYIVDDVQATWSEQNKIDKWWDVEFQIIEAWSQLGVISKSEVKTIQKNVNLSLKRMLQLEKETKHDVVAFTRMVSESLDNEARWVHLGVTSTDVVDTAQNLIIRQNKEILFKTLDTLQQTIDSLANEHKNTLIMGRSHGIYGEPTSLGLKFLLWKTEIDRQIKRIATAFQDVCVTKISGSMGNYANLELEVELIVSKKLKMPVDILSTQVSQRDRLASLILSIANLASTFEKIATEIRMYNRSEIKEICEGFSQNQKGSSSMPHKKNPISSENITGLSRMLKAYVIPALENNVLWHERDISHSSNERIILPDMFNLIVYITKRMNEVISNLYIDKKRMLDNISSANNIFYSQVILTNVLKNTKVKREEIYDLLQEISLYSLQKNQDFLILLKNDKRFIKIMSPAQIDLLCNHNYFLRNVDKIFLRVKSN